MDRENAGGFQMITTSVTPLRVSFLGGGSDYKEFYERNGQGFVFGTTVNLYVYVSIIRNSRISGSRFKISYRELDECNDIRDIRHPVVKSCLQKLEWGADGLHISTMSDVPAGTGLGSSSSFTVGLLNTLYSLKGVDTVSPSLLAQEAISVERDLLGEAGGVQDQLHAAFGGLAGYRLTASGKTRLSGFSDEKVSYLSSAMVLIPVGNPRSSASQASKWIESSKREVDFNQINQMSELAESAYHEFKNQRDPRIAFEGLAIAMNRAWELKNRVLASDNYQASLVDSVIVEGLNAGAKAGKLCGAGTSGFVLFLVPPESHEKFLESMKLRNPKSISVENRGSWIANLV
jgi:D-glycero-alpha-D-manno-heptose-7-phosphate kinase